MEKTLLFIVVLLLISCSSSDGENSHLILERFDSVNEQVKYQNEMEHIDPVNDEKLISIESKLTNHISKELISNAIEMYSSEVEIPKDESKSSSKSIDQKTESTQITDSQNSPEMVVREQIETSSHPPVTTPPPKETTPSLTEESEEVSLTPLCPNAWYDENQPCDWIHPNLKPTDELGRTVPIFSKSEDAWNWAEKQFFNETSTWYMCGFNLMDGHTNDGTNLFYGYMKACP